MEFGGVLDPAGQLEHAAAPPPPYLPLSSEHFVHAGRPPYPGLHALQEAMSGDAVKRVVLPSGQSVHAAVPPML